MAGCLVGTRVGGRYVRGWSVSRVTRWWWVVVMGGERCHVARGVTCDMEVAGNGYGW